MGDVGREMSSVMGRAEVPGEPNGNEGRLLRRGYVSTASFLPAKVMTLPPAT